MTFEETVGVLREVRYKDWQFRISHATGAVGFLLSVQFKDADGCVWNGRKWYVSPYMTRSEIVQTALKAVLTAEEHEAREQFTYKGKAIFGPHLDVEKLVDQAEEIEVRA